MRQPMTVGHMLGRCDHLARERMVARLSRYDVTPAQTHALIYLHCHGGAVPQCEMTDFLKVKPSTANGILDRMEEKELVVRTVSGSDARRRLIALTDKGREQQSQVQKCFQEAEDLILKGFAPEEAETFRAMLGRIIQNLEEDRAL